jgi:hypothetical protein
VFENRVLWKTFGPNRDEVTREWIRVYDEELYDLYSPPILFGVIISRMRWMGICLLWERREVHTGFWWRNPRERGHFEDIEIERNVISKWVFKQWNVAWTKLIWLRTRML